MGWASAGEIFDATAHVVLRKYEDSNIDFEQAVEILGVLARKLRDGDCDTEDESVWEFQKHPVILAALKVAGWKPYPEEEE